MAYVTAAEMQVFFELQEIVQISNLHSPNATAVNVAKVESALDWASGLADSYLGVRYVLPIPSTPTSLKSRVADIARYDMDSVSARPDVRARYEDALKWLKAIASGEASLGSGFTLLLPPLPSASGGAEIKAPTPIFGGGGLDGF